MASALAAAGTACFGSSFVAIGAAGCSAGLAFTCGLATTGSAAAGVGAAAGAGASAAAAGAAAAGCGAVPFDQRNYEKNIILITIKMVFEKNILPAPLGAALPLDIPAQIKVAMKTTLIFKTVI